MKTKKGDVTWETIVKLIIALVVFLALIALAFIFKERLFNVYESFISYLRYGGGA